MHPEVERWEPFQKPVNCWTLKTHKRLFQGSINTVTRTLQVGALNTTYAANVSPSGVKIQPDGIGRLSTEVKSSRVCNTLNYNIQRPAEH